MSQVSKYPLAKDIEKRVFEVFVDSLAIVRSTSQVNALVNDLFSQTERIMLAKRISIAMLLLKKYDQRAIAKILKVSLGTVNRVSMALQRGNGYTSILNVIMRNEKFMEYLDEIDDKLADFMPPVGRNWSRWRRQRWEEKRARQKTY